jgi:hypothetical protein
MIGPGKYDDVCTTVRHMVGLTEDGDRSGGVVLIVFNGDRGHGFSVQCEAEFLLRMPEMLEELARQLRNDVSKMGGNA